MKKMGGVKAVLITLVLSSEEQEKEKKKICMFDFPGCHNKGLQTVWLKASIILPEF